MAGSEKLQQAIRRSTRLPLEVPVHVTGLGGSEGFSEHSNTTLVNAHGCGLISTRPLEKGSAVRIEIVPAKRQTTARVADVVPLGSDPETWLLGLEFDSPGNFWGIEYPPSDWKIEEAPVPPSPPEPAPAKPVASPRRWRLTDISGGACYLDSATPFPAGTAVLISVRLLDTEYLLDGVVRASHPQAGMGVEFAPSQQANAEELIRQLSAHREVPKIFVGRKEGPEAAQSADESPSHSQSSDPLLDLVRQGESLTTEQFLNDLQAQRSGKQEDSPIEMG